MGISSMIAKDYQNGETDENPSLIKSIG